MKKLSNKQNSENGTIWMSLVSCSNAAQLHHVVDRAVIKDNKSFNKNLSEESFNTIINVKYWEPVIEEYTHDNLYLAKRDDE